MFELTIIFKHEMIGFLPKISKKLRIKWNFELTVFELSVPDLYIITNETGDKFDACCRGWSSNKTEIEEYNVCMCVCVCSISD